MDCSMPPSEQLVPVGYFPTINRYFPTINRYADAVMSFLRQLESVQDDEPSWFRSFPDHLYPKYVEGVQYFEPLPEHRTAESGIYLLTAIDFILNDAPCIFFLENIKLLRLLLSHQVLVKKFPI